MRGFTCGALALAALVAAGCAARSPRSVAPPPAVVAPPLPVVSAVSLEAEPREYSGRCPTVVTFKGRMTVAGGPGVVTYRFTRSDGATAPTQTLAAQPGEQEIATTWTLGGAGEVFEGWQGVEILSPNPLVSARAPFRLDCTSSSVPPPEPGPGALTVTAVDLLADPRDYSGPCPVTIRFKGTITVEGEGGRLSYRFNRSDGAIPPTETLTVGIGGAKTVTSTWMLGRQPGGAFEGWQVLEVLPPHSARSRPAGFRIVCR
jgi:hypothetical protein